MDGHSSHYTADLLEYCHENNIEVYGYPPHCTHALQGLDVVCFAIMKECWKEELDTFEKLHNWGVNKEDFAEVWGHAYQKAFTEDTICSAFKATGIHPFNPDVISECQMKPAIASSTKATFPLPQPSPVRAVMAAARNYKFTHQVLHPDSPPTAGPTCTTRSEPSTPNLNKRYRDPLSNPELPTPTKRMRFLGAGLAATSASFLVEKKHVMVDEIKQIVATPVLEHVPQEFEEPDWELLWGSRAPSSYSCAELKERCTALAESLRQAEKITACQNLINEGQNTQLIIQNMAMVAMVCTLHEKEKLKPTERSALFPDGNRRHLTAPEFVELKRRQENDKKQEEEAKKKRKEDWVNKKALKEQFNERWKAEKTAHEKAVKEWQEECNRLQEGGTLVKNLPKRPLRKTRAELEKEMGLGDESDDEDLGNDDWFTTDVTFSHTCHECPNDWFPWHLLCLHYSII
jgi:hypothetical protein